MFIRPAVLFIVSTALSAGVLRAGEPFPELPSLSALLREEHAAPVERLSQLRGSSASQVASVPAVAAASAPSAAYAWGDNEIGQLGDGTTVNRASPVAVSNLSTGVTAIAAGSFHGLAIQNGVAYAWGSGAYGQLGNGTTGNSATPVAVQFPFDINAGSAVAAIAGGYRYSMATRGGAVYTWGDNQFGQLGDGTTNNRSTPFAVTGLSTGVTAIAAGDFHSLALQSGAVYAWGYNNYGQLGNGTAGYTANGTPTVIGNLSSGVTAIAAGGFHCLALRSGVVYAWGDNNQGQLGNGTITNNVSTPAAISGLSGVTSIAAGGYHSLAVQNGNVYAWGYNDKGQLGDGTINNNPTPAEIDPTDLKNITAVAAGLESSYALASDGSLWVWGDNYDGELGLGNLNTPYTTPQHVLPPSGYYFSAIDSDADGYFADAILTAVPEPSTWAGGALLLGVAGLSLRRRCLHVRA